MSPKDDGTLARQFFKECVGRRKRCNKRRTISSLFLGLARYTKNNTLKAAETNLEGERIQSGRAGRGIVKNAPSQRTRAGHRNQLMRKALELVGTVFRIVNARRAMQPKVKKSVPSTRLGSDAADPKLCQQIIGVRREPVGMARLANYNCDSTGPSLSPSPVTCARKASRAALAPANRSRCVISCGALTAKAKRPGTAAAQRS